MERRRDKETEFGPTMLVREYAPSKTGLMRGVPGLQREKTIMVLEDNPVVRGLNVRILQGLGCRVLSASSPARAIPLFKYYPGTIDLIVCDVLLPKMSGPDVMRAFRDIRSDFQVLYVTGASDNKLKRYSFDNTPVLRKPYRASTLKEAVQALLSGNTHKPGNPGI